MGVAKITLSSAGPETGPFDLYTNLDGFTTPFEVGVSKAALLAGFVSNNFPYYPVYPGLGQPTTVRIKSTLFCINYIDVAVTYPVTTTTTTTSTTTTTISPS
jgi:hypothetical protein